jgi:hypothetical protein
VAEFTYPWRELGAQEALILENELRLEVRNGHPLFAQPFKALARKDDSDEVLFAYTKKYAVVHLTYSGKGELSPDYPWTLQFNSLDDI